MTLRIEIQFFGAPLGNASERTRGQIRLTVGDHLVWDFEWTWIELVEHLAANWSYLRHEETAPHPFDAFSPESLSNEAQRYFDRFPDSLAEDRFEAFLQTHDLSRAVQGAWPTPLWLMRWADHFFVSSPQADGSWSQLWIPAEDVLAELERTACCVLDRLSGATDPRSNMAESAWGRRDAATKSVVEISTGWSTEDLSFIASGNDFWPDEPELQAVARMSSGVLDRSALQGLVQVARQTPRIATPALDTLTTLVTLPPLDGRAHNDGHRVASDVLSYLGRASLGDPQLQLDAWGVRVVDHLLPPSVDAICLWGSKHGPVIFINPVGLHSKGPAGRRATLAHEVGHLVMDRPGALPLAEVWGGRMPKSIEQRARAFAAEVLVPRRLAADAVLASSSIADAVNELQQTYGVSAELAAWQIRNSGCYLHPDERDHLRRLVRDPARF